tara:strand:- start:750 stop:965 length:216 start_codon:yes stop_codon:yes gene_type:complete
MTLDKEKEIMWKAINKQGRYIEQLEIMVAHLKKDSHPPVFKESQFKELDERLKYVEAWINNIELIDKGELN